MRIWREGVRAALGAALVLAVVVGTASAHSILQRSIPSANASLSTPPRQLLLVCTVFFEFLILRPLRPRPDTSGVLRAATVTLAAVLLVGLTGEFVLEAAILLATPVTGVWRSGTLWTLLGGTKTGWSTLARAAGAIILLIPPSSSGRILRAAMLIWCVIVGVTAGL